MTIDINTLHRNKDGVFVVNSGEQINEMFPIEYWDCPEAFKMASIRGYEPMTAKELETDEEQDLELNNPDNYVEEKFDGTRALVYFLAQEDYNTHEQMGFCRVFSRRVSKKTNFYVENTDSLPQIREIDVPELAGTILDGEMFINGLPFKEVSNTLNCLWDKAIDRQLEKGFITFHAFDILFYKGVDLRKLPLERRKVYLNLAVEESRCEYIEEVQYFNCGTFIDSDVHTEVSKRCGEKADLFLNELENTKDTYPHLYKCWKDKHMNLTPRAYYELIVATGGEGIIVKPKKGKYLHKRGWEYSKVKKFLTREMIVLGFNEPTKEYTGKDIRKWGFWVEKDTDKRVQGNFYGNTNYIPVTKHYYYSQVGNLLLGVIISEETLKSIPKQKRGILHEPSDLGISCDTSMYVMEVCECNGFNDEIRDYFTRNREKMVGTVIEVKANELIKDTGRLRHPRYLRMRTDKNAEDCVWEDHIL